MNKGYLSAEEQYKDYKELVKIYFGEYMKYISEKVHTDTPFDKYRGVVVSREQAEEFAYDRDFSLSTEGLENALELIKRIEENSAAADAFLPMEYLAKVFEMDIYGKLTLFTGLCCGIDDSMASAVAYMNDNVNMRFPSLALAVKLFYGGNFLSTSNIRKKYMPLLFNGDFANADMSRIELAPHWRISDFLLGGDIVYRLPYSDTFSLLEPLPPIYMREGELSLLEEMLNGSDTLIVNIFGETGCGKKHIIKHCARRLKRNVLFINMDMCDGSEGTATEINRELKLQRAVCCINAKRDTDVRQLNSLVSRLNDMGSSVIVCSEEKRELSVKGIKKSIFVDNPDYALRLQLWNGFTLECDKSVNMGELADKYRFTCGQIVDIINKTEGECRRKNISCVTSADIEAVCVDMASGIFSGKASRITCPFTMDDLILPDEEKRQIYQGLDYIRYHHRVYDEWNFNKKVSYGRSLSMLFEGSPGTGKTMAASIIGNELGLPVYKIDLSKIMSKYIGETEKSIGEIFDIAQNNNAVLFFDETDALFGKRSEIKDSHDKYANIEVSYLLQRIEEYDGVVIMTTNFRQNIDEAFIRRISCIIHFSFPDAEQRELLWKSVFPKETPFEGIIDYEFLANRFEMSGAMIKNAALSAAFLAAGNGKAVSMGEILKAVKKQFLKSGKNLTSDDFEPYTFYLE